MGKTNRKGLVKKLDKLVSQIIVKRDEMCVICDSTQKLGCGHVFSRIAYSLRWDVRKDGNCHCQCWGCNYRHEFDPHPYFRWYEKKFGKDKLDKLHRDWKQTKKWKNYELEELASNLKKKLESC